jgi:hypothetical protein
MQVTAVRILRPPPDEEKFQLLTYAYNTSLHPPKPLQSHLKPLQNSIQNHRPPKQSKKIGSREEDLEKISEGIYTCMQLLVWNPCHLANRSGGSSCDVKKQEKPNEKEHKGIDLVNKQKYGEMKLQDRGEGGAGGRRTGSAMAISSLLPC